MTGTVDIYEGRDPRAIGIYPLADAARFVRVPVATLRSWCVGRDYSTTAGGRRWEPIIATADVSSGRVRLSFKNLVEAHVLSVLRDRDVSLDAIRSAVSFIRREFKTDHPFADVDAKSDRMHVYVEHLGQLWNASRGGQAAFEPIIARYLQRIERDENGIAQRLFPFTADREVEAPRLVVIDPRRRFGRPIIPGGVETWVIHNRWRAGESTDEIAQDLDVSSAAVEEALRFEDTIRTRRAA